MALAGRYGEAEQRSREGDAEGCVDEARALIDRALVAQDTGVFHDAAAAQTARLLGVIARRVAAGKIDPDYVQRLLDAAFGPLSGDVLDRLAALEQRCASQPNSPKCTSFPIYSDHAGAPLCRADMLQLKHLAASLFTV